MYFYTIIIGLFLLVSCTTQSNDVSFDESEDTLQDSSVTIKIDKPIENWYDKYLASLGYEGKYLEYLDAAYSSFLLNKPKTAISYRYLEKCFEIDNEDPVVLNNLGFIYKNSTTEKEYGIELLKKAARLGHPLAQRTLSLDNIKW